MNLLKNLLRRGHDRGDLHALYGAIIDEARQPGWYRDGGVADSVDGRFEMVSTILAFVLMRLEQLGEAAQLPSAQLAEVFVEDMDGQMREIGIGDVIVGKHIGKMMATLGGKLGAYREALAEGTSLDEALVRNLYRGDAPDAVALGTVRNGLLALHEALGFVPLGTLLAGKLRLT